MFSIYLIIIISFLSCYLFFQVYFRFYSGVEWDYLKNQDFFDLKVKYAIYLIPIPFSLFFSLSLLYFLKWINYL